MEANHYALVDLGFSKGAWIVPVTTNPPAARPPPNNPWPTPLKAHYGCNAHGGANEAGARPHVSHLPQVEKRAV